TMLDMNDLFQRMRELAIKADNDTLSENERSFIQKEVEQLTRQVINLGNTTYKGNYIFGGKESKLTPFPVQSSEGNTQEDYDNLEMAYYDASGVPPGTPVQLYDAFDNTPLENIIPGTFDLSAYGTDFVEGEDYEIDYANGTITILPGGSDPAMLSVDTSPGAASAPPLPPGTDPYESGGFSIGFDYIGRSKDIYGDYANHNGEILRQINTESSIPINITKKELTIDPTDGTDMVKSMIQFNENLYKNNRADISNDITNIDKAMQNLLAAESRNGSRVNRFEKTRDRNETQTTEKTRLQSQLEDADFAETAQEFSLAQTVYNAALKSTSNVIQTSLVNFL
ncbi:MAG: flagellin, partial [Chitinivibrionales bacterium]